MSDSNSKCKNEEDKIQQEENPVPLVVNQFEQCSVNCQDLTFSPQLSDLVDITKEADSTIQSENAIVGEPQDHTGRTLRKKDSTGVRWVDWEGVAEISQKKVLDSPTDAPVYTDDWTASTTDYIVTFSDKDIKAPQTLPLSVEQVKLDSLTEASVVKQQESEEVDSDSDFVLSPDGRDTLEAHVDIIKERYNQIAKMRNITRIEQENPFRPEGEVSKEANEIVDAIQSGNLQNIYSTSEGAQRRINDPGINPDSPEQELEKLVGGSVSECDIISGNGDMIENSNTVGRIVAKESLEPGKNGRSTNATVEVHKTIITPSQTQDVSIVVIPEKNSGCCVIL